MQLVEAIQSRRSVRAFLDRPVSIEAIQRVVAGAAQAPSGGNLQPWHVDVVGGDAMLRLKALMRERVAALSTGARGETAEYEVYPRDLAAPYRDYRYQLAEAMYARLGIPRNDKPARLAWFARNYQFFGAPLALFISIERSMGLPQWADLGMYLQTVMLLLRGEGLHSCPQECWAMYPQTVGTFLQLPAQRMLFSGLAIRYADPEHPLDDFRSARAPAEVFAKYHGL